MTTTTATTATTARPLTLADLQGRVALRRFTSSARLSQETLAWTSDVVVDGVVIGTGSNEGHGGPDHVQTRSPEAHRAWASLLSSLPDVPGWGPGAAPRRPSEEDVLGLLVDEAERAKALASAHKAAKTAAKRLPPTYAVHVVVDVIDPDAVYRCTCKVGDLDAYLAKQMPGRAFTVLGTHVGTRV
jgi:hypothetical protein